jgi:hypothetical protein
VKHKDFIYFKTGSWTICWINIAFGLNIIIVIAADGITVASIVAVSLQIGSTVVRMRILLLHLLHHHGVNSMLGIAQIFPFVGSMLDVKPKSFFSFPSFSYGYQNRACFDIL